MTDIKSFCQIIKHAKSQDRKIEKSNCRAIKFDDDNGFLQSFDTNYSQTARVDYIEIIEQGLILIETKDLKQKISALNADGKAFINIKKAILDNLAKKYQSTLTILADKVQTDLIPVIYYVVVKNNTDITFLDNFLTMEERNQNFILLKTDEICQKLNTFTGRLCQD